MPTISTLVVNVEAKTSKFSSGVKTAVAGLGALAVAGAYAFKQFEESDKVARQTEAVLASTGNAANVTADQVADLSSSLSEKSAIDDEVIQSGENMLLTFKNIQNGVGEGNDIFNQASSAALDMAAGMAAASGGAVDMKSASIQLGKALNDPVAGISALSRVGVTFTEQQKKQIEALVESGDTMAAQKIILGELNSEFAGSAAAGKTSMAALSVSVGNLAEAVGGVLAPAINAVLNVVVAFFSFLGKYPALLVAVAGAVAAVAGTMLVLNVQTALATEGTILHTSVLVAKKAAEIAGTAVTWLAVAAQWAWNAALTANPIGLIIVAIAAAIGIIAILIKHFHLADDIMNVLKKTVGVVWGFIKAVIGTAIKLVIGYIKLWIAAIGAVIKVVGTIAGIVGRAFMAVFNFVKEWLGKVVQINVQIWGKVISFFAGLGARLARGARNMWDWLVAGVKAAVNTAIGVINSLIGALNSVHFAVHLDPPGPGRIDFEWSGLGLPTINTLKTGGLVTKTGIALVHEGEQYSGVGGWKGGVVNVYVQGSVIAEKDLADTVQKVLLRSKRRSGTLGLA